MSDEDIFNLDWVPVSETLELDANLSTAAAVAVTSKLFDFVTHMSFILIVSDAAMEWTEFAEGVTLTNGFYIRIDGVQWGPLVKTAEDLAKLGKPYYTSSDADAVKVAYIRQTIVDFTQMTPFKNGIRMRKPSGKYRTLDVWGQDDMTAAVKFQCIVEGYKMVSK